MSAIRWERDAAGVMWVWFDAPDSKVNVLSRAVMGELEAGLDEWGARDPRGWIFISAKPDVFIAGADIRELAALGSVADGVAASQAGQRIFAKIEQLRAPTVAAIHGACLGGGCELALACRVRVATDHPKTQIGLPETQLGILPGWGGSQRLPRLIGLQAALGIMVPGGTVKAEKALRLELVDAVVPPVALRETAVAWLGKPSQRRTVLRVFDPVIRLVARKRVLARTRGLYPAPLRAIEVVGRGYAAEAQALGELVVTPVCKNLIRVFFLREKYTKWKVPGVAAGKVGKVGVIGAGVMGAGIAQWCAARGLPVRLKDIKPEFVANGVKRIASVFREGVQRRKLTELEAQHGLARVHPTTDYTGFGSCDLVIEAVLEKIEVKRALFAELTPHLPDKCIIASNTSAIPIDDLATASGRPDRFVGIHFFNPVHKMPLVEVVRGTQTSPATLAAAVEFVKQLKKIPVIVRGTPGFLVNRLLMPYLNEAGKLVGEGVNATSIDAAMLAFGMPMGPLRLLDEVGLDVAFDVARELAEAFRDRMTVAPLLAEMHAAGLKGRKGGSGFYHYEGRSERPNRKYHTGKSLPTAEIQQRLLAVMIAEAKLCLVEKVVETEDDIDVGIIFGTGFPPFRGGLVKYARDAGLW